MGIEDALRAIDARIRGGDRAAMVAALSDLREVAAVLGGVPGLADAIARAQAAIVACDVPDRSDRSEPGSSYGRSDGGILSDAEIAEIAAVAAAQYPGLAVGPGGSPDPAGGYGAPAPARDEDIPDTPAAPAPGSAPGVPPAVIPATLVTAGALADRILDGATLTPAERELLYDAFRPPIKIGTYSGLKNYTQKGWPACQREHLPPVTCFCTGSRDEKSKYFVEGYTHDSALCIMVYDGSKENTQHRYLTQFASALAHRLESKKAHLTLGEWLEAMEGAWATMLASEALFTLHTDNDGKFVRSAVMDNGKMLPPEERKKIAHATARAIRQQFEQHFVNRKVPIPLTRHLANGTVDTPRSAPPGFSAPASVPARDAGIDADDQQDGIDADIDAIDAEVDPDAPDMDMDMDMDPPFDPDGEPDGGEDYDADNDLEYA